MQIRQKEKEFIPKFQRWLKYNHWGTSFPWEAKVSYEKSFNYKSGIKDVQLLSLSLAKHKQLVYKISDEDQRQKPFDGIFYTGSEAYFIIWWVKRANKEFFIIDIDVILKEIESGNKSLTEERARQISFLVGELK